MRFFAILATASAVSSNNAVNKVIQLLQDMRATAKAEKQAEEVAYSKFQQFCTDTLAAKKEEISAEESAVESLTAAVAKSRSDAAELGDRFAALQADIAKYNDDKKSQENQREKDHADFLAEQKDYSESVDALSRAVTILKRQNYDRKQVEALIQTMPARTQRLVQSFIAMKQEPDYLSRSGPDANAYEFQAGGIVEMLERLQDEFEDKLHQCEKEEMNGRHAFEMIVQDLTDSIKAASAESDETAAQKAKHEAAAARQQAELEDTATDLAADKKYRSDLNVECNEKAASFTEKQQLRADEIEAIAKAVEILSSGAVKGAADTHLAGSSFVQLRASSKNIRTAHIAEFLQDAAEKLHSKALTQLALAARADPFEKVRRMIRDMVDKLLAEANAEAEQKGFCDKEMGVSKQTRAKLARELEELTAEMESQKADAQRLGTEIETLSAEIAALDKAVADATAQRDAEHAKNTATIKDARDAQTAVTQATAVLRDFYAKAATATAFIQEPDCDCIGKNPCGCSGKTAASLLQRPKMGSDEWNSLANPSATGTGGYGQGSEDKVDKGHLEGQQTFGDRYDGQQDKAGGVLAMLEVIASDFAALEADTTTAEAQAAKSHEEFTADAKKDKSAKSKSVELKTADKGEAERRAATARKDWSSVDDENRAAERYWQSIKEKCVVVPPTFEERQAQRKAEVESLKEALQLLANAN